MTDTGYYDTSYPPYLWADPNITTLSPNTGTVAGGPYTVTVNGSDFYDGSRVEINQTVVPTTFISSTQLRVTHTPDAIGTDEFTVRNGAGSGGEESNSVFFTVTALSDEEPEPEAEPDSEPNETYVAKPIDRDELPPDTTVAESTD